MNPRLPPLLAAAVVAGCFGRPARETPPGNPVRDRMLGDLRTAIEDRLRGAGGVTGLHFHDMFTGDRISLRSDRLFHAASILKLFVLIEVHKRVYETSVSLDDEIETAAEFPGAVDGRPFAIDDAGPLRARLGRADGRATIRELCDAMIAVSNNCATNNLIRHLGGPEAITQAAHAAGATRSRVPRYIMDAEAFARGINAETCAGDVGAVLEKMALGQLVNDDSSRNMVETLKLCEGGFLAEAIEGEEAELAHKTGAIDGVRHDAGIVFTPNGAYVLVILMEGLGDDRAGHAAGRDVARMVYDYVQGRPR